MNVFQSKFQRLIEQDEASADQQAMATQLDQGTKPEDFDVATAPQIDQARASHNAAQKQVLTTWIQRVAEFVTFLNGTDGDSVQSQLAGGSCDTLFEKIATSEKKRISRVAMELSSLNESLKGYLITSDSD
jgi:hypothetical protein